MSTTLFDLLWQLKRELERQGGDKIDLPRFVDDAEYRRQVLTTADLEHLREELRQILPALNTDGPLEITRRFELESNAGEGDQPPPVIKGKGGRRGVFTAVTLALLLVVTVSGLVELTGDWLFSGLIADAGVTKSELGVVTVANAAQGQSVPTTMSPHTAPQTLFRLHGSNTIGESLAPALLKSFWQQQGAQEMQLLQLPAEVERDLLFRLPGIQTLQRIELKAHGSSTGFKGLQGQITDLAMASRRIKEKERASLEPLYGDLVSVKTEHIIGMDGLAIIVHPQNPINSLSTAQLARLFSGQLGNWKEIGGADLPVTLYSRDENSGTWDSFKSMVLKKHGVHLSERAQRFESSTELSDRVSQDPGAIGFIGLPYVLRAKALAISDEEGALPVFPTSFTVSTEDYPLTRRLYIYEPMTLALNSPAHRFVEFVSSEEGQEIVRKSGFISQNIHRIQPVLNSLLPSEYVALTRNSSRLSLNFRFNSGTFELDNKAQRDMERIIRFFEQNPGEQVILIGFSDSTGESKQNRQLSLKRAELVRDQLLARGINVAQVYGLGDLAPVASNATIAGRERNRRVEIWVRDGRTLASSEDPVAVH